MHEMLSLAPPWPAVDDPGEEPATPDPDDVPGLHLVGSADDDLLAGSAGADTLEGGRGDDIYHVNDPGDLVVERRDQGHDRVIASVDHRLRAHVEDLELVGEADLKGTGNALDNRLVGNAGHNTLNGAGGADTMEGGDGDDTYVVNDAGYQVVEAEGQGIDLVRASVSHALADHVENLTLTGSAAIAATGNGLDNRLRGNAADNILFGGAGNDMLIGGLGNDTYLFGRGDGVDTVGENDATIGNTDVMRFLQDVAIDQLWFRRTSNHLEVSIIGTEDKATINNWYRGAQHQLERFEVSEGQALLNAQVDSLVQAMAAFAPPPMGQSTLPPDYAQILAPLIAASWN
jgi:Ca2+-binding RTX toxin-like protein